MGLDADLLFDSPQYIAKRRFRRLVRGGVSALRGVVLDVGSGKKPFEKYIECDRYVGMDVEDICREVKVVLA